MAASIRVKLRKRQTLPGVCVAYLLTEYDCVAFVNMLPLEFLSMPETNESQWGTKATGRHTTVSVNQQPAPLAPCISFLVSVHVCVFLQ